MNYFTKGFKFPGELLFGEGNGTKKCSSQIFLSFHFSVLTSAVLLERDKHFSSSSISKSWFKHSFPSTATPYSNCHLSLTATPVLLKMTISLMTLNLFISLARCSRKAFSNLKVFIVKISLTLSGKNKE